MAESQVKTRRSESGAEMNHNGCQQQSQEAPESARELAPSGPRKPRMKLTEEQLALLYVAYKKLGALISELERRARDEAKH